MYLGSHPLYSESQFRPCCGEGGKLLDLFLTVQLCAGTQDQDPPAWLQQGPSHARAVGML